MNMVSRWLINHYAPSVMAQAEEAERLQRLARVEAEAVALNARLKEMERRLTYVKEQFRVIGRLGGATE